MCRQRVVAPSVTNCLGGACSGSMPAARVRGSAISWVVWSKTDIDGFRAVTLPPASEDARRY